MSSEWEEYAKDPRTVCKYGVKCYQKNPQHHSSYKHPPNLKNNRGKHNKNRYNPYKKEDKSPQEPTTATTANDELAKISEDSKITPQPGRDDVNNDDEVRSIQLELPSDINYYSANTDREVLKELFLVEMPPDFFKFYECFNEDNDIVKTLASVKLQLVGPYDLLLGKLPVLDDKQLYLVHWRYFYDPPEFQTVLRRTEKGEFHIGYYRDDPQEPPVFLASNDSSKDYHIKPIAENIFGAVHLYLQNERKSSPFTAIHCQKLIDKLKKYTSQNQISLDEYSMKKRQAKIVSKTFHGGGIVVPYNKKTQLGYRRLAENDATIKKLFDKLREAKTQDEKDKVLCDLQPIITYASIAMDECDFGTGLEAGIALFCSGLKELEPSALSNLTTAYSLLNREAFGKIIQAHLKLRRKGPIMSIINEK